MELLRCSFATLLATLFHIQALAQPGTLDSSFGTGGIVVSNLGDNEHVTGGATVLPGGQTLVAGYRGETDVDFFLARYTPDGALDASFGAGGYVEVCFGAGWGNLPLKILLQSDGNVLLAGQGYRGSTGASRLVLARHLPDGTLDPTFGTSGYATASVASSYVTYRGAALDADGRVIIVGAKYVYVNGVGSYRPFLMRYLADGTLDSSFGNGGTAEVELPQGSADCGNFNGVVALPGGESLVRFSVCNPLPGTSPHQLWRFNADGTRDLSYGASGAAPLPFEDTGQASPLALLPDGRAIVAGHTVEPEGIALTVARLHSDGALDTSYGTGGVSVAALTSTGTGYGALDVVVESDGAVALWGLGNDGYVLVHFLPDGTLDASFGDGGVATVEPVGSTGRFRHLYHIASQPDGRVLVAGTEATGLGVGDVLLMRFRSTEAGTDGEAPAVPTGLALEAVYPNPARAVATARFALASAGSVRLALYDVLGREVAVLAEETRGGGEHEVAFDTSALRPGFYVLRLTTEAGTATRRLTVVR